MRKKPKDEWHRFDFSNERRLGEIQVAISLNADVARKFIMFLQGRVKKGTGLRFKIQGEGAIEIVHKGKKDYAAVQLFDRYPYIFPDQSPHTDRYDSEWNRVETYIPLEALPVAGENETEEEDLGKNDEYW